MTTAQRFPHGLQVFLVLLSGAAAAMLSALAPTIPWEQWPGLLLFVLLIMVGDALYVANPRGGVIGTGATLIYTVIFAHGPGAAMLAAGLGIALAVGVTRGWVRWRVIVNGAQIAVSAGLAGMVYVAMGGSPGAPVLDAAMLPAAVAAVLVFQTLNNAFFAYFYSRVRDVPFVSRWFADFREWLLGNVLAIPLAVLLAYLYVRFNPFVLLVYLVALPFQRQANHLNLEQQALYAQIVEALVVATDVSFPQARGHARQVADLSVAIAREMRMAEPDIQTLQFAAMLHDVGMIGMDELLDRGDLTPDEFAKLKEHVQVGATIARELPRKDLAAMVLMHHEHYDGTGYPQGLRGERIPLGARILALAETYETMRTGATPYDRAHTAAEAIEAIRAARGRAFDPAVVDAFLAVAAREGAPAERPVPSRALQPTPGGAS